MSQAKAYRLQGENSPYLQSAAHQPVEWYPWGREALARAQREDRPILLDIGAVWCHWCHVMDRESYENPEVAEIINRHFIPIKVDRDERPDIDGRYQAAVSAISGQGGWPLTAFLTPEGKPFFGGTYFPPEDTLGRPGFKRLLVNVAANYQSRKAEIRESANQLTAALSRAEGFAGARRDLSPAVVQAMVDSASKHFDIRYGGFGGAPKFSHPNALELLLERYQVTQERTLLTLITTTLDGMAGGGVYDQIAGGFHRYSVDERWRVPHFEKMSYDNSELLKNYLHAYQVTGNLSYRRVAEEIVAWVESTLSDPARGGFFASQDADASLEDDGDYFTWTREEVRAVLSPAEAELVVAHFDVGETGEMHHHPAKNVLWIAASAEELARERTVPVEEIQQRLRAAKEKMLEARRKRPTPYIDRTLYVSWNAMFISAFLEASRVLGSDPSIPHASHGGLAGLRAGECREFGLRTLARLLGSAWDPAWGFAHRCPAEGRITSGQWAGGGLEDQAFMAQALLDAFELTGERRYLEHAERTLELCLEKYWDAAEGGFFDRPLDAPPIAEGVDIRRKPLQDAPTPAANPVAAMALDRLASFTGRPEYREKAREILEAFGGVAEAFGLFAATYGLAALLHTRSPLEVVIVGAREDARTRALADAAHRTYRFGKAVLEYDPKEIEPSRLPAGLAATLPHLAGDGRDASRPRALLCVNATCQPPLSEPQELAAAIVGAAR